MHSRYPSHSSIPSSQEGSSSQSHFLNPPAKHNPPRCSPMYRILINEAIIADPALLSKSMDIQLRFLIIDPLLKYSNGPHFKYPPTIFINGLDECDTIEGQVIVLNLIVKPSMSTVFLFDFWLLVGPKLISGIPSKNTP
ncbi:hypothetical protein CPB83DRAFT_893865 [Crepidotus variabilis]|uniref:Uncharacterized protein n=1 Tax=Crepidotus variabilis TaxID=179855 RepID=A0A9P6JPU6_9AGAR|nr:hypothetical protein CPB83DRAFT_893865 [Crepidotus variabilis]